MKYTVRAVLAVTLLVGVYVLAGAVLLGVLLSASLAATSGDLGLLLRVVVLGGLLLLGLGRGLVAGLRPSPRSPGIRVSEQDQPRLWAEVRAAAQYVGTAPPDEIVLSYVPNAGVSEEARWLGLVAGRRRLLLGLPLLVGLTELQLRAILGHELGHYSGRHTALARVTYRGQVSLQRIVAHLGRLNVTGFMFWLYGRLFLAVARAVSRRQELEADAFAARLAGRNTMVTALHEVTYLAGAWALFLRQFALLGIRRGLRPTGLYDGYQVFLGHAGERKDLAAVRAMALKESHAVPSLLDTHPSHGQRAAALRACDAPDVEDGTGPAFRLLENPAETFRLVEEMVFAAKPGSAARAVSWDELAATTGARSAEEVALRAVACPAVRGVTHATYDVRDPEALGVVLDLLRAGRAAELARGADPAPTGPGGTRTAVVGLLLGLVDVALLARGASYVIDWGGVRRLVDADGNPLERVPLVAAAVDEPAQVGELADWLRGQGVPWVVSRSCSAPGPAVPATVPGPAPGAPPRSDVPDGGASLGPLDGGGVRGILVRADALVLTRDSGDVHLPWDQVAAVDTDSAAGGALRVTVRTHAGHTHAMRVLPQTRAVGDPWEAIRRHLGEATSTPR